MVLTFLLSTLFLFSKKNNDRTFTKERVKVSNTRLSLSAFHSPLSDLDLTTYPFMLPTATGVATCAITAGIGGAALFAPIFLIVFPLLGPQYPLESSAAAVATAILVESFGFSSGLVGYFRRGLIDYKLGFPFLLVSIPSAIISAKFLSLDPIILKCIYTTLMLSISGYLFMKPSLDDSMTIKDLSDISEQNLRNNNIIQKVDGLGKIYKYPVLNNSPQLALLSLCGGVLTGCLGVGIGEVTLPQLLNNTIPVPIAAATSTFVVALTAWSAAIVQVQDLISSPLGLLAIPWKLIIYMIPGVIIGGQIAATLQGKLSQKVLERAIAVLFGTIGLAFACLVGRDIVL